MTQTTKPNPDSITKVHFPKSGVYKYMSGKREPIAVRIDTGLYSAFKPLSKRVYGSTCKAVEVYMIALIEAVENGVYFSNTDKPIHIDKIVIERNLRERRKFEVEHDDEVALTKEQLEVKTRLEKKDKRFKLAVSQWIEHADPTWRQHWFLEAAQYPELESAKALLALRKTE
jgi:hypothetical protein